jgi:hypothetical protein
MEGIKMHAMVRFYTGQGATELFKLLEDRKEEVEGIMREVPGLVSYDLVKTEEGGMTMTVCADKTGTNKSLAVALGWLKENAAHLKVNAPGVSEGTVAVHLA